MVSIAYCFICVIFVILFPCFRNDLSTYRNCFCLVETAWLSRVALRWCKGWIQETAPQGAVGNGKRPGAVRAPDFFSQNSSCGGPSVVKKRKPVNPLIHQALYQKWVLWNRIPTYSNHPQIGIAPAPWLPFGQPNHLLSHAIFHHQFLAD